MKIVCFDSNFTEICSQGYGAVYNKPSLVQVMVAWWQQAITWTDADLSSVSSSDNHIWEIWQDTSSINHQIFAWKLFV